MLCPYCGGESTVIDSRLRSKYKWRNRRCKVCGRHFSTHETYSKDYEAKPRAFIRGKYAGERHISNKQSNPGRD